MAFEGIDAGVVLQQAMKVAQFNHRLIANNIANIETPGYNGVELDFQRTLRNALENHGRPGLRSGQTGFFETTEVRPEFKALASTSKNDYNKVDADAELAKLSENTGNFTVYSALLAQRFSLVKKTLDALR